MNVRVFLGVIFVDFGGDCLCGLTVTEFLFTNNYFIYNLGTLFSNIISYVLYYRNLSMTSTTML